MIIKSEIRALNLEAAVVAAAVFMIAVILLLDNCHFDVFNAALFTALSLKQNVTL